jgi:hypothetical protein
MSESKIIDCYKIEDNQKALSCLKEVTQEPSPCRARLVLFTQDNCTSCKQERKRYQDDIENGIIEEIRIDSPEGTKIADKNGIVFVPALVVLDCHDNIIEPGV